MNTRIVNVSEAPASWNWLSDRFSSEPMTWHACSCYVKRRTAMRLKTPAKRIQAALSARHLLRKHPRRDVLVSHGPLLTLYSELFADPADSLHLAFSFNFTNLPTGNRRLLFRRYLKRVDRLVVASSMERNLYSEYFEIDPKRVDLLLWSINPSTDEATKVARFGPEPYICAIGSQARDYETLMQSMRRIPSIRLVVVASPDSLPRVSIPSNVRIVTNVPLADAMNILAHSRFMVLPLKGSAVPCGHVTAVSAFHMGKAILATDSSGLHDYLYAGNNADLVEANNPDQMADRIQLLFDDPELCTRLGAAGRQFARKNCMEDNAVDYFRQLLKNNNILE